MEKGFFHHTLILTMASILVRLLGAIYRIILPRLIGAQGVGLFQMAYPVYSLLLVAAIPGFPLAISKLVAEGGVKGREEEVGFIFLGGLLVLFLSGLLLTIALILLSPYIAKHILGDHRSYYPLLFLAPSLFFFFLIAAFRGYFQGLKTMFPTALSLVVEQLARLVTIILILYVLRGLPIEQLAGGVALGNLSGAFLALVILLYLFVKEPVQIPFSLQTIKEALYRGFKIYPLAIPISLGALIMPLMGLVDAMIVPIRLQMAGRTMEEATSLYGQLSGMAMTVFFFPTVISGAIALSILPFVSLARVVGDYPIIRVRTRQAFRLVFLVMFPAMIGILLFSKEICQLLFGYPMAGIPLFYLAFALPLYALQDISASILQGLNEVKQPAVHLLIGAFFNGILNYSLTPLLGIRGAAIGTTTGIFLGSLLNLRAVNTKLGITIKGYQDIGKPFLAALWMGILLYLLYPVLTRHMVSGIATIFSILLGMIVYFSLILINGGLKVQDLQFLPIIGPKIIGWFNLS